MQSAFALQCGIFLQPLQQFLIFTCWHLQCKDDTVDWFFHFGNRRYCLLSNHSSRFHFQNCLWSCRFLSVFFMYTLSYANYILVRLCPLIIKLGKTSTCFMITSVYSLNRSFKRDILLLGFLGFAQAACLKNLCETFFFYVLFLDLCLIPISWHLQILAVLSFLFSLWNPFLLFLYTWFLKLNFSLSSICPVSFNFPSLPSSLFGLEF